MFMADLRPEVFTAEKVRAIADDLARAPGDASKETM